MSQQRLRQQLQHGIAAQQRGDVATAAASWRAVLAEHPEEPDAWQLLGGLARRQGDDAQAEACWRRSLRARPAQPHVLNNLANLLFRHGQAAEALTLLAQAVALKPDYADAHYNLARMRHAQGDAAGAAQALQQALQHTATPSAGMCQLQAQLLADGGQLDDALKRLEAAVTQWPGHAALQHNRAVLLHRLGRHEAALQGHQQAAALGADDADAHYNRGNTLQALGRHEEARQAYQAALQRRADHPLALLDLARLRWRMGDAEPDRELKQAEAAQPQNPHPALLRGQLRWRAEDVPTAAQAFEEALRRAPGLPAALAGLGRCRVRLGELEAGLALQRQALQAAPADVEMHCDLARSLLVAARPQEAAAVARQAHHLAPLNQHALALLATAWRLLGDARARWLEDPWSQVAVIDPPPPPGWPDMPAFLAHLAQELDALHHDREAPVDQTLRHGTQTLGQLFDAGHPAVQALQGVLTQAVQAHIDKLPRDTLHPVAARAAAARQGGWRFTDSWSSRLVGQGFHIDHVHPHGWFSSVFYVRLPHAALDPQARQGWLRLGQPDMDLSRLGATGGAPSLVQRMVAPRPGRLVLFPSMMWHGTTPFEGEDDRLTIAFDLVPRTEGAPAVTV